MVKNDYKWWTSIVTGVAYIAVVYLIFTVGLQIQLYPGLAGEFLLSKLNL
jgi:hypothetical protein